MIVKCHYISIETAKTQDLTLHLSDYSSTCLTFLRVFLLVYLVVDNYYLFLFSEVLRSDFPLANYREVEHYYFYTFQI